MGSLSDYAIGVGTSVVTASQLTNVPTQGLRSGDFAFVTQTSRWWAFDATATDVVGATVVLADVAQNNAANPGRWKRTNITFA